MILNYIYSLIDKCVSYIKTLQNKTRTSLLKNIQDLVYKGHKCLETKTRSKVIELTNTN